MNKTNLKWAVCLVLALLFAPFGAVDAPAAESDYLKASDGWFEVTTNNLSSLTLGDYYFAFYDKHDVMLGLATGKSQGVNNMTVWFQAPANPLEDHSKLWCIETMTNVSGHESQYTLRSYLAIDYVMESVSNSLQTFKVSTNRTPNANSGVMFTKNENTNTEGYWTLRNGLSISNYLGPWDGGNFSAPQECAFNKSNADKYKRPTQVKIYAISRSRVPASEDIYAHFGSSSQTSWKWTDNPSQTFSATKITLSGVEVTMGSSTDRSHRWEYDANNGFKESQTANVNGTGVTNFSVNSPYGTLPNRGAFLKIVPSRNGKLVINIQPSGSGDMPNVFVTTSDGSTITHVQKDSKRALNLYELVAGNTYYFFPEAKDANTIGSYRWLLQNITFHSDAYDLTFLIKDADCTSNNNWSGQTRVTGSGKHWSGDVARTYFERNCNSGNLEDVWNWNRQQTITLPVGGNYLLKTAILNTSDNASSAIRVGTEAASYESVNNKESLAGGVALRSYNYYGLTGGTIATDGTEWPSVAAGTAAGKSFANSGNGYGWFYNNIYFTAEANSSRTIIISQTSIQNEGGESGVGGMQLLYYGDDQAHAAVALDETQTVLREGVAGVPATFTRSFVAGYNTICLPFAITDIEGVFGTNAKAYDFGCSETDGKYTLNFTSVSTMAANTPYLLYLPEALSNVNFGTVTIEPTLTAQTTGTGFDFVGSYVQTNDLIDEDDYLINAAGLVKAKGGNKIRAFRAFIDNRTEDNSVKDINFVVNDEQVTAIDCIQFSNNDIEYYNLSGVRVLNPTRGIYIMYSNDGTQKAKKVFLK